MLIAIERLQRISERCREGRPLEAELAGWFGQCLATFLERGASSFDEAFGLASRHGGVPWWKQMQIRERDDALRALAANLAADASLRARAQEIERLAVRYAASAWRIDRDKGRMPDSYAGTPREQLWRAFRSGAPMPLGERQIRNILVAGERR